MSDSPAMIEAPQAMIRLNLKDRGYDIIVATGSAPCLGDFARDRARTTSAMIISDQNVDELAQRAQGELQAIGFETRLKLLPSGEAQKSMSVACQLYDWLADNQADRRTLIVAVGGGVIGDLAGFVAATYARGLPLLMVPTTLLAMVDSSVGGKVGVNLPQGKNLVGCFHQPIGVWIDTAALSTLPDREFRSGLAEVVKYGVILDAELFAYLEANVDAILKRQPDVIRHIVARCCRLKADVVEQDEREESGLRAVLNYGHTFAHAFETVSGYGHWLHGEAVAAGMICASRLAERRGLIPRELTERQERLLSRFGLPTAPENWPVEGLLQAMRHDKKNLGGRMRFVLPHRLGQVALIDDVSEEDVRSIWGSGAY